MPDASLNPDAPKMTFESWARDGVRSRRGPPDSPEFAALLARIRQRAKGGRKALSRPRKRGDVLKGDDLSK